MLQRLLICGLLLYAAVVVDLGLPTWIRSPALPSCLLLLLVLLCQHLKGPELVFWAGLVGLAQDELLGASPGPGIVTAATVGLVFAVRRGSISSASLTGRLLEGLAIMLVMGGIRAGRILLARPDIDVSSLASMILIRTAATFLLLTGVCMVQFAWQLLRRRSYQLEHPSL
jgi:hypothetical protein